MASPRYRLRSGLQIHRVDGRWQLRDRALRRAMRLGDRDARVLRLLGEGRGRRLDQLAKDLGSEDEARTRLGALSRLYLLSGKRAQERIRLGAEGADFAKALAAAAADPAADAAQVEVRLPTWRDPPRHSCVATGACCSASFLGPMSEPDRVRVSALTLGARARVDQGSEALESVDFRGQELWGMRREAGTCVALGDDGLCDLHAEHGYDIKPIPCRQFPLRFHRTPWGLHVSLLLACEGYDRARGEAADWSTREAEVRGFLAEGARVPASAVPFEWSAGVPASVADTRALLGELAEGEPDAAGSPRAWLAEVIRRFERAALARDAALREGDDVAAELATAGLATLLDGDAPWFADLSAHKAALFERAETLADRDEPADALRLRRFARGLDALTAGLSTQGAGALGLAPLARRHLLDIVANDLSAQVALGHVDAGLANLAVRLRFAEALACAFAADEGRAEVSAKDTTLALKVAYRSEPDLTALARQLGAPAAG